MRRRGVYIQLYNLGGFPRNAVEELKEALGQAKFAVSVAEGPEEFQLIQGTLARSGGKTLLVLCGETPQKMRSAAKILLSGAVKPLPPVFFACTAGGGSDSPQELGLLGMGQLSENGDVSGILAEIQNVTESWEAASSVLKPAPEARAASVVQKPSAPQRRLRVFACLPKNTGRVMGERIVQDLRAKGYDVAGESRSGDNIYGLIKGCLDIDLILYFVQTPQNCEGEVHSFLRYFTDGQLPCGLFLLTFDDPVLTISERTSSTNGIYYRYGSTNKFKQFIQQKTLGWVNLDGGQNLELVSQRIGEALEKQRLALAGQEVPLPAGSRVILYSAGAGRSGDICKALSSCGCEAQLLPDEGALRQRVSHAMAADFFIVHTRRPEEAQQIMEPLLREPIPESGLYPRVMVLYDELEYGNFVVSPDFQRFSRERLCGYAQFTGYRLKSLLSRAMAMPPKETQKLVLLHYFKGDLNEDTVALYKKCIEKEGFLAETLEGDWKAVKKRYETGERLPDITVMCGGYYDYTMKQQKELFQYTIRYPIKYILMVGKIPPNYRASFEYRNAIDNRITGILPLGNFYDLPLALRKAMATKINGIAEMLAKRKK